jgi:hypothetical protein
MPRAAEAVPAFDSQWLDDMVNRLKAELEAQLTRVQKAGESEDNDARTRSSDARTLASLERTLEKLAQLEQGRALVRETKISKQGSHDALECRLDKLAAAGTEKPDS